MTTPSPIAHCLTVSQLNEGIRELLEEGYPYVQVRGEIADWKNPPSGHIYFTLMDAQSRIRAVIWRATRHRLTLLPKAGDAVLVTGRIAVYLPRGEYQLIVEAIRPDGAGSERERLLALLARLTAEGLFDPARKRPLPMLPEVIGVVTSASGAAIHDIIRTLDRRTVNYHLILAHARVQGDEAPAEITHALNRLIEDGRAEIILCGRGGGSAEDLAAFNSEMVVRAIAASPIPVISAVGHEIDLTLADLAADARASTPSAAAELAMPEQSALLTRLFELQTRMRRAMQSHLHHKHERLNLLRARLIHPRRRIEQSRQRCDDLEQRLLLALNTLIKRRRQAHLHQSARLEAWSQNRPLALRAARLAHAQTRLARAFANLLQHHATRHRLLTARLMAISPMNVLNRGYALVQDEQGHVLHSSQHVQPGATLNIVLATGALTVQVTKVKQPG